MDNNIKSKNQTLEYSSEKYSFKVEYDKKNSYIELFVKKESTTDGYFYNTKINIGEVESGNIFRFWDNLEKVYDLISKLIDENLVSIKEIINDNQLILLLKMFVSVSEEPLIAEIKMKKKFDQNRLINKLNERIEELTFKEQDINGAIKILSEKIDNLTYKEQDINGAIKILSEKIDNLTYKDQDINGAIKILSEKIDNLTYKDQDIENVIKNLSRITNKLEKYKKQQKIDQSKLINKLNKQIEELTFKEHDIDGALKMLFEKTGKLEDGEIKSLFERIGKLEDGAIKSLFERIGKLENGTIKMLSERISKLEDGAIKTLFERIGKLENGTIKMLSERISKLEKECKRQQKIKILQIYPKVEAANQLRQWMEIEGYGKGIIDVNSVCLTNFNKEPYEWLKLGDKWNYDIILFGIWDANCGIPLEDKAVNAITAFINDGGGCILTHDTTGFTYGKSGFNKLREMFGIKVGKWGKNPFGDYDNQWGYFSTKIKITKTGSLTTYPWKIGEINKVFPVLSTHTTSTAAYKDNVWIELCEGDYKCGKEPNAL